MDRETLDTLCRTFAARQSSGLPTPAAAGTDPVSEILRSFRLAEISAAEMESLLGLVTDADTAEDGVPGSGLVPAGIDGALDEPPALVDDFPDFDDIVAAGFVEDDDSDDTMSRPESGAIVEVRLSPAEPGAEIRPG